MSLYNMVRGYNPNASICCAMLGVDPRKVSRFRDAWLSDDGAQIVILTRTGGGNRDDYQGSNEEMHEVAGFISDEDDDFDSTFAKFTYATPVQFRADSALIAEVMALAGKSAKDQGPGSIMLALNPDEAPKPEITAEDPRVAEAEKAFERIIAALSK